MINLTPSRNNDIASSYNQIITSNNAHNGHTPSEIHYSSIGNVISYSASNNNNSNCWLIDFGSNGHIFSYLHLFESFYHIRFIRSHLPNRNCPRDLCC